MSKAAVPMEKLLEIAWVGPKVVGGRSQGITRVEQTVIQVDGVSHMVSAGLIKGMVAFASTFAWEKAVPSAFALMLSNSVLPYMFLLPVKLLPSTGAQRE